MEIPSFFALFYIFFFTKFNNSLDKLGFQRYSSAIFKQLLIQRLRLFSRNSIYNNKNQSRRAHNIIENRVGKVNTKGSVSIEVAEKKKKHFFWLVVSVGIFDFLSHTVNLSFYIFFGKNARPLRENNLSSLLIFNTIIIYLLSRFILKLIFIDIIIFLFC